MLATDEKRGLGGGGGRGAAAAATVDLERNRFPFSIVWQPFPVLGWILPCIGHMGICDSEGVVHDFQGPYTIIKVPPPSNPRAHEWSPPCLTCLPPPPW